MRDNNNLRSLFKTKQTILLSKLKTELLHPTSKGDNSESAWKEYLEGFLPKRYKVDKGFVYDSDGNKSDQIDIIVYDPFFTPLIFDTESGEKMVAAESVYAVFECKQKINKSNVQYASKKIASVTGLRRKSSYVIDNGTKKDGRKPTPIIGGLLAVDAPRRKSGVLKESKDFSNIQIIFVS